MSWRASCARGVGVRPVTGDLTSLSFALSQDAGSAAPAAGQRLTPAGNRTTATLLGQLRQQSHKQGRPHRLYCRPVVPHLAVGYNPSCELADQQCLVSLLVTTHPVNWLTSSALSCCWLQPVLWTGWPVVPRLAVGYLSCELLTSSASRCWLQPVLWTGWPVVPHLAVGYLSCELADQYCISLLVTCPVNCWPVVRLTVGYNLSCKLADQ